MKTYKIEVTELVPPPEGEKYGSSKTVYSQVFDSIQLEAIIAVANGLTMPFQRVPPGQMLKQDLG